MNERKSQTTAFELEDECLEEEEETDMTTQFLQMQKSSFWTCNSILSDISTLYLYSDSAVESTICISSSPTSFFDGRDIQPTVIKTANHFVSVGDVQFPDFLNFLGWDKSLDSFLKAYESSETNRFLQYE